MVVAGALLIGAVRWGATLTKAVPPQAVSNVGATGDGEWQVWSPQAVHAALEQGHPVLVDFTAAWCLSCKVNERVALESDAVKTAFKEKGVVLFRADWTHANADISAELQKYNRDGVPLYLLYSPKAAESPEVLPEVLAPGLVVEAVGKL